MLTPRDRKESQFRLTYAHSVHLNYFKNWPSNYCVTTLSSLILLMRAHRLAQDSTLSPGMSFISC